MNSISKPLKVSSVYLKGNDIPLRNRKVAFLPCGFLIVAKDGDNTAPPIWYNVDMISRLEGVEPIEAQRNSGQRIAFL